MQIKRLVLINIALAAVNALLGIINGKWFLIVAALVLSLISLAGAIKYLSHDSYENLRSFSWYNIIAGLSILSLAFSSFYGLPQMGFVQIVLAIAMTLVACYTLYTSVKVGKVAIIP